MEHDNDEGMSTGKKVVAGAAIGVAVPAAVGVAKKLLGNGDEQDSGSSEGQRSQQSRRKSSGSSSSARSRSSASKRGSSSSKPSSGGSSRSGSSRGSSSKSGSSSRRSGSSSSGGSTRTKEQLYNQAKRLKIEGRSAMTKTQLQRAINRAK